MVLGLTYLEGGLVGEGRSASQISSGTLNFINAARNHTYGSRNSSPDSTRQAREYQRNEESG